MYSDQLSSACSHEALVIPFPIAMREFPSLPAHSVEAGGWDMTVKHTHPSCTQDERLERLKAIRRNCIQLLDPRKQEERAG